MGLCTLQEIKQLDTMRQDLGLPNPCISEHENGQTHFRLGYCQGLFNPKPSCSPAEHTQYLIDKLEQLGAPMPRSHELFNGLNTDDLPIQEYISQAANPLINDGTVPIIITQYDPGLDYTAIKGLADCDSPLSVDQTILIRMQVTKNTESIANTATIVRDLHDKSLAQERMPSYWPLIQADTFDSNDWSALRETVGENLWNYVTIAATPFTLTHIPDEIASNIAVAQIFVGSADGVESDGDIELSNLSCVRNGLATDRYNVHKYAETIKASDLELQVAIICGQAEPDSNEDENAERIERTVPLIRDMAQTLWDRVI